MELNLPSQYKYTLYVSFFQGGVATLWDADARLPNGTLVAGVSANSPMEALTKLLEELPDV